ncbi:MAG: hypothetical protein M3N93_01795 [Acidobacteriota bacterium]|nr:hypothetical protein [Acidobacteriota bacterium]
MPVFLSLLSAVVTIPQSWAQTTLGPVTLGAGIQTSFVNTKPTSGKTTDQFTVDHARLYISGPVTDKITLTFNTDYDSSQNKLGIMDAIGQFAFSPHFNIWAGRFLPPGDRSNLYGPFYSNNWRVYTDGIQDGYPMVFQGRADGVAYWGEFAHKVHLSAGAFDGASASKSADVIGAGRIQVDFWDPEDGYYQNGTYYGDKNVLAIGVASQVQNGHTASTIDFLLEKKVLNGGAFTIESELSDYNRLGGYGGFNGSYAKSKGFYVLSSLLFPKVVGIGKFQLLGKYARADFRHGTDLSYAQKTTEVDFNYIIKQFKARVMSFYEDTRFNRQLPGNPNFWQLGLGLQLQM